MSERWPGGIINQTAPVPSGSFATSTASGVWTLDQQAYWQQQGNWPIPGNFLLYIEDVFSTYLYLADGTNRTIVNGIDLSTKGGLCWIKSRNDISVSNHLLFDTVRGDNKVLYSNLANAESDRGAGTWSPTTSGFTVLNGHEPNYNTDNYVSWTFREQPKFFDVVTWTGNGVAGRTVSHNLGSVPGMLIVKQTNASGQNWIVWHRSIANTQFLMLNRTDAVGTYNVWNNTTPTSTVFTVSDDAAVNGSGDTYVAYLFAHNAGGFGTTGTDNVISCGSYTSSGSIDTISLGYEPQWIMMKPASSTGSWYIFDVMRGMSYSDLARLFPNTSSAESVIGSYITPTATGFVIQPGFFGGGTSVIYMAIRRPMKVPTDATTVFKPVARAGTSDVASITGLGFAPDSMLTKNRGSGGSVDWSFNFFDRLRSGGNGYRLSTAYTNAEDTSINFLTEMGSDGVSFPSIGYTATNGDGYNYINYMFARRPGFFDEVCYTGNGVNGQAYTHNLGVTPEFMIFKRRNSTANWASYHKGVNGGTNPQDYTIYLNLTNAQAGGRWASTVPTSTQFTVGNDDSVNLNNGTYIAYLFATCPGVSKVGSYTGNGTTQAISCGFTGGARFVLIKRTDSTGDWYVYDTARGMTTVTDPYLLINSTAGQVATLGSVTTTTGGFTLNSTILADINISGGNYIFLAIA